MAKPQKGKRKANGDVITDPRFAKVHTDARFQIYPNKQRKVEIDDRFKGGRLVTALYAIDQIAEAWQALRTSDDVGMLTEERFQHRAPVDKRGRKVKLELKNQDLARYYRLRAEDDDDDEDVGEGDTQLPPANKGKARKAAREAAVQQAPAGPGVLPRHAEGDDLEDGEDGNAPEDDESSSSSEEEEEDELDGDKEAAARWARMRGLAGPDSSSSSSDEEDDDEEGGAVDKEDEEEGALEDPEWGVGALAANPNERIPEGDETARLALLDLDWDHVRAVDILAVLRSFLVKGQRIECVTVYPSDYGLAHMAEEAKLGPRAIFTPKPAAGADGKATQGDQPDSDADKAPQLQEEVEEEEEDEAEEDNDAEVGKRGRRGGGAAGRHARGDGDDEEGDEVDQARLRMYERSKLRYFYAVVVCDCVATAAHLYRECDGLEFELTANRLDLRFVPEGQSFEGRRVRDEARDVPAGYEPPPAFATAALQHTAVKLTWDAEPAERRRALSKRVTAEQLRDDDFKAYLGSESESGSEEEHAAGGGAKLGVERYRQLLLAGDTAGAAPQRKGGKDWGAQAGGQGVPPEEAAGDAGQDEQEGDEDGLAEEGVGRQVCKAGGELEEGRRKPRGHRSAGRQGDDDDVDMEVTFASGLETLGERLAAKRAPKAAQTVWEQYIQRRREKKEAAKRAGRRYASSSEDEHEDGADSDEDAEDDEAAAAHAGGDPFFQHDEDPFADPFFQGGNEAAAQQVSKAGGREGRAKERAAEKAAAKAAAAEEARRRAELELLMLDEGALQGCGGAAGSGKVPAEGAITGKASRKERLHAKKAAKRAERAAGSDDEDIGAGGPSVEAALDDPRFSGLVRDAAFALDPTDPRFKQAEGAARLAAAVARRKTGRAGGAGAASERAGAHAGPGRAPAHAAAAEDGAGSTGQSAALKAMIASLKNKAARRAAKQGTQQPGAQGKLGTKGKGRQR